METRQKVDTKTWAILKLLRIIITNLKMLPVRIQIFLGKLLNLPCVWCEESFLSLNDSERTLTLVALLIFLSALAFK